jgi:hypothetical protein
MTRAGNSSNEIFIVDDDAATLDPYRRLRSYAIGAAVPVGGGHLRCGPQSAARAAKKGRRKLIRSHGPHAAIGNPVDQIGA